MVKAGIKFLCLSVRALSTAQISNLRAGLANAEPGSEIVMCDVHVQGLSANPGSWPRPAAPFCWMWGSPMEVGFGVLCC